jgi:uncharacterized membrane protein YvlD (DUF360 family)
MSNVSLSRRSILSAVLIVVTVVNYLACRMVWGPLGIPALTAIVLELDGLLICALAVWIALWLHSRLRGAWSFFLPAIASAVISSIIQLILIWVFQWYWYGIRHERYGGDACFTILLFCTFWVTLFVGFTSIVLRKRGFGGIRKTQ